MDGSLELSGGILYVGRHAKTARVRTFDLDGHTLETHFSFRDPLAGRSSAAGIAVDADHRIWVADEAASRLRCFTLFGQEVASVGGLEELDGEASALDGGDDDRPGRLGSPVDVLARGSDDELRILVASSGPRRHALQELHPASGRQHSLRPLGDPQGRFEEIVDLAGHGDTTFVCERRGRRIQVFIGGDYHYSLTLPGDWRQGAWPSACAPVGDGRLVVAVTDRGGPGEGEGEGRGSGEGDAVLLLDAAGRLMRVLAGAGEGEGQVSEPCDLVLDPGTRDEGARVAVLDRAAERVQILTLDGICWGAFPSLRGRDSLSGPRG